MNVVKWFNCMSLIDLDFLLSGLKSRYQISNKVQLIINNDCYVMQIKSCIMCSEVDDSI